MDDYYASIARGSVPIKFVWAGFPINILIALGASVIPFLVGLIAYKRGWKKPKGKWVWIILECLCPALIELIISWVFYQAYRSMILPMASITICYIGYIPRRIDKIHSTDEFVSMAFDIISSAFKWSLCLPMLLGGIRDMSYVAREAFMRRYMNPVYLVVLLSAAFLLLLEILRNIGCPVIAKWIDGEKTVAQSTTYQYLNEYKRSIYGKDYTYLLQYKGNANSTNYTYLDEYKRMTR